MKVHLSNIYPKVHFSLISLSNGEDFITTEQLQKRMRSLASPSTSNTDYSQSNNIASNSSHKGLGDDDNNCFPRNGLPEDSSPTRDEDRANDIHGENLS